MCNYVMPANGTLNNTSGTEFKTALASKPVEGIGHLGVELKKITLPFSHTYQEYTATVT